METKKLEVRKLLNDKKFWVASFLIAWAAALQGHMMWLKRQDSFKQKFGTTQDQNINDQDANQDSIAPTNIFEAKGGRKKKEQRWHQEVQ